MRRRELRFCLSEQEQDGFEEPWTAWHNIHEGPPSLESSGSPSSGALS